jgi:hypothetical protein
MSIVEESTAATVRRSRAIIPAANSSTIDAAVLGHREEEFVLYPLKAGFRVTEFDPSTRRVKSLIVVNGPRAASARPLFLPLI